VIVPIGCPYLALFAFVPSIPQIAVLASGTRTTAR
jgi:hypothetical protein